MRRAPFRQVYVLMLGLLVALGMSLSAVHASNMAVDMTMSGHEMSAGDMGDCSSCKHGPSGTQMMACDAACVMAMNAMVPPFVILLIELPVDRPVSQAPALSGWTASPNPHPPKRITLA
jgi:hypothetical protein